MAPNRFFTQKINPIPLEIRFLSKSFRYLENTESKILSLLGYFAQTWLPTVQEVLQADWQEAWHSPQPPSFTVS
jgi:hypothetical protein